MITFQVYDFNYNDYRHFTTIEAARKYIEFRVEVLCESPANFEIYKCERID